MGHDPINKEDDAPKLAEIKAQHTPWTSGDDLCLSAWKVKDWLIGRLEAYHQWGCYPVELIAEQREEIKRLTAMAANNKARGIAAEDEVRQMKAERQVADVEMASLRADIVKLKKRLQI